jgi:predicted metal-dependent peptidase
VKGRGGTNFGPVIEYYLKHFSQYDTLVMFTDGEAPINYHVPQDNILWVISSAGAKKDYPGKAIYIPKNNNNNTNNQ